MKYIKQYKIFMDSLNDGTMNNLMDYYDVFKLKNKGYTKNYIINKLKLTKYKFDGWLYTNSKPIPIKRLELYKKKNYFDDNFLNKNIEWLAYIVGYNLGDGNISRNFNNVWFYGVNSDLEKLKNILLRFNVNPIIYTYKIDNGKMAINDTIFSRFLCAFGAINGDKTKSNYYVPEWILKSGKASVLKKRFLQGLCDSELSKLFQIKNRKFSFQSLKFYMVKEINCIKVGKLYMDQLRNLFYEFGITTTDIKEDRSYIRSRDNSKMLQLYFLIHSNYINLDNFLSNVGFLYTSKRIVDPKLISKIKDLSKFEKEKRNKYKEVLKLRKKGLSAYKIAKILGLPTHLAKQWCYYNRKPRSLAYQ